MAGRQRSLRGRLPSLGAGAVALALGLLALGLHLWPRLEGQALDARFALRGTRSAPGVVVVAIDDATFSALDRQWPFPRRLDAEVIDRLHRDGARAIAYDVQFTEPSRSPRDDLALYDAVARARDVVLATTEVDRHGQTDVFGSEANVRAAHAVVGMANLPADPGGVIRRYDATVLGHPSFAVAAARVAGDPPGAHAFGRHGALVDYRGGPGTIRTVSFASVLRGEVSPRTFAGRVVVVGATSPTLQDLHETSTTGASPMSGAEVQADAIWTAMHDNPLRPTPGWLGFALVALCALSAPLAATRLRAGTAAGVGLATLAGVAVAAQALFDHGAVIPVSYPLIAGAVGTLGTLAAGYARAVAERGAFRRELLASQLELLERLSQAIDSRHAETGEHTQRIGLLSRRLALALGWRESAAEGLMHAAVAHDVGKIGIADELLLRPGPLSPEEWQVMQSHTEIGARLLSGSGNPLLQTAERIALTHHERWDGSGYPRGLRGTEIPVEGRICAVVDVYDALLSQRAYKDAWSVQQTIAELERGRGTHFDPEILDAFLTLLPELHGRLAVPAGRPWVAPLPQPAAS